jgi:aryl-alcohol dehydrogenase-like predicted oxidoreductase
MIETGKIRFAACSNYASWQVCQMRWIAEKCAYKPICVAQPMYNLLARGIEQEFMPMAREFGLSVFAYNPLAGGLLTGKHGRSEPATGSRFVSNQVYRDRYWHSQFIDAADKLRALAASGGHTLIGLAFNWLLHHTGIAGVVLGASSREQLANNLLALEEGPLGFEIVKGCNDISSSLKGCVPQYNR